MAALYGLMFLHHLGATFLLFALLRTVRSNTEIINFATNEQLNPDLSFTHTWPTLGPPVQRILVNVTSAPINTQLPKSICKGVDRWSPVGRGHCPFEYWLVLDLDGKEWKGYDKFTLRASWPASHPTDITMSIFDASDIPSKHSSGQAKATRKKYARLQFVHSGVLTPSITPLDDSFQYLLSIAITLEPLQFGFLPQSVVPAVGAIVAAVVLGYVLSGELNKFIRPIVESAKQEQIMDKME